MGKPLSKYGVKVWNFVAYSVAAPSAKLMVNSDSVKSGLITGTQWDTIMQWYQNSNIIVNNTQDWGTYANLNYSGEGEYWILTNVANNIHIYDWTSGSFKHTVENGTEERILSCFRVK